jgi:hypothetical protein
MANFPSFPNFLWVAGTKKRGDIRNNDIFGSGDLVISGSQETERIKAKHVYKVAMVLGALGYGYTRQPS